MLRFVFLVFFIAFPAFADTTSLPSPQDNTKIIRNFEDETSYLEEEATKKPWIKQVAGYIEKDFKEDDIENIKDIIARAYPQLNESELEEVKDYLIIVLKVREEINSLTKSIAEKLDLTPEETKQISPFQYIATWIKTKESEIETKKIEEKKAAEGSPEEYISTKPHENPKIKKDFLKTNPYSMKNFSIREYRKEMSEKNKQAPEKQNEVIKSLSDFVNNFNFWELFFYDLRGESPISGKKGFGKWFKTEEVFVRLISTNSAFGDGKSPLMIGLHFATMKNEYIVPWRTKSDLGNPFYLDLSASKNLDSFEILWPTPSRYDFNQKEIIGYKDTVIFPLLVKPSDPELPLEIKGKIDFDICYKECKNYSGEIELNIDSGIGVPTPGRTSIERFFDKIPKGKFHGLFLEEVVIEPAKSETDSPTLRVTATSSRRIRFPDLFVENDIGLKFRKPYIMAKGKKMVFRAEILPETIPSQGLDNISLNIIVKDYNRSLEAKVVPKISDAKGFFAPSITFSIFLMAFLAGLLINIVPVKLAEHILDFIFNSSFVGGEKNDIQKKYLFRALGSFFAVLLITLISFNYKQTVGNVDWNIFFTNTFYLFIVMTIIIFWIAELWGGGAFFLFKKSFEKIRFYGFKKDLNSQVKSNLLNFVKSGFLVLIAAPFATTFVASIYGFAFFRESFVETFLIMFCVAFGSAFPYLFVAKFPLVTNCLPPAGMWLFRAKKNVGLLLLIGLFWIMFVMNIIVKTNVFWIFIFILSIEVLVLLFWHYIGSNPKIDANIRNQNRNKYALAFSLVLVLCFVMGTFVAQKKLSHQTSSISTLPEKWREYNISEIEKAVSDGKTVFVEVYADWCLSCRINNFIVFKNPRIKSLLNEYNIIPMRADWTHRDENVTVLLNDFGEMNVPLYLFFDPKFPKGITLSGSMSADGMLKFVTELNQHR